MRKKTMLRLMILALAAILLLAGTVLADGPTTYTITINNATEGYTYAAYQVFSGDLSGNVLSNVEWGTGVNDGSNLLNALKSDETIGSHFTDCTTAADVANVLATSKTGDTLNFASDSANLDAFAAIVDSHLNTSSGEASYTESKYTISNLSAGYYFVKNTTVPTTSGAYTKFMLNLIKSVAVTPKADVPAVEKKVQENVKYQSDTTYGTGYNDVADWNIGDHVPFKLIGTVPKMDGYETYTYTFHDTLSTGLTLNKSSVKVYLTEEKNAELTELSPVATGYTLNTSPAGSHCTFEISFSNLKNLSGIDAEKTQYLIVTYTATLNSNAEIGLDGNPNEVYLTFSNNPNGDGTGTTPEDSVIVFTYELDTTKVAGENTNTKLENAEFVLLNSDGTKVAKVNSTTYQFEAWVNLPEGTGASGAITYENWTTYNGTYNVILSSDVNGLFKVIGLDDGTYKLREIKAPNGYNLLPADVEVVITATTANGQSWGGDAGDALTNLAVTADAEAGSANTSTGIASITIANNQGSTLPETGGMGTTIFYVVGGLLVVGAAVLLITKKRMSQKS